MKKEIEIFTLAEHEPEEFERVMVCRSGRKEWNPQVYNKHYECWDTEDGDDYGCDLNIEDKWFSLKGLN